MVFSIQCPEDVALPPPYKWNKAPSCCSFLLFPSLAANNGLVDMGLSL